MRDERLSLANHTSIGESYARPSSLEQLVLAIERRIDARPRDNAHSVRGEQVNASHFARAVEDKLERRAFLH